MNSLVDPRLLESAQSGVVSYALLIHISVQSGRSAPDLLDDLSYFIASQYSANEMSFEQADFIMNALWSACVSEEFWADNDRTIPATTNTVYLAFDAGEYYRESDPPGTDPEVKYTKPLIAAFLAEHDRAASGIDQPFSGGDSAV